MQKADSCVPWSALTLADDKYVPWIYACSHEPWPRGTSDVVLGKVLTASDVDRYAEYTSWLQSRIHQDICETFIEDSRFVVFPVDATLLRWADLSHYDMLRFTLCVGECIQHLPSDFTFRPCQIVSYKSYFYVIPFGIPNCDPMDSWFTIPRSLPHPSVFCLGSCIGYVTTKRLPLSHIRNVVVGDVAKWLKKGEPPYVFTRQESDRLPVWLTDVMDRLFTDEESESVAAECLLIPYLSSVLETQVDRDFVWCRYAATYCLQNESLQKEVCCHLVALAQKSPDSHASIVDLRDALISIMRTHLHCADIQLSIAVLLGIVALHDSNVIACLAMAIEAHHDHRELVEQCTRGIWRLAALHGSIASCGALDILTKVFPQHLDSAVFCQAFCGILYSCVSHLSGAEPAMMVLSVLESHGSVCPVQKTAWGAMWVLAPLCPAGKLPRLLTLLLTALKEHGPEVSRIVENGFGFLQAIAGEHVDIVLDASFSFLPLTFSLMEKHLHCVGVHLNVVRFLANCLMQPQQANASLIARAGLVDLVLTSTCSMYAEVEDVADICLRFFAFLACADPMYAWTKVDPISEFCLRAVGLHENNPLVVASGCHVLWSFVSSHKEEECHEYFEQPRFMSMMKSAMETHKTAPGVQECACGFVWNMMIFPEIQARVSKMGFVSLSRSAMLNHYTNDAVLRTSAGALWRMSETMNHVVTAAQIIPIVRRAMKDKDPTMQENLVGVVVNLLLPMVDNGLDLRRELGPEVCAELLAWLQRMAITILKSELKARALKLVLRL